LAVSTSSSSPYGQLVGLDTPEALLAGLGSQILELRVNESESEAP
jgi:hypothetical protein